MTFSKRTKAAIKGLAVAYEAFNSACDAFDSPGRDLDICVWGEALLGRQKELGVELGSMQTTRILIEAARRRQAERKEIAA